MSSDSVYAVHEFEYRLSKGDRPARSGAPGDRAAGPPRARVLTGDIVVSTETARRMARAVGWTPRQELAYYIVHGLLHLTGYDDQTSAECRQMRARERAVMKACGLPVPPRTRALGNGP